MSLIYLSIFLLLSSCSEPLREYKFDNNAHRIILKLYADSTFIEQVEEVEDNYEYSGNWSGSLNEGSTFTTVATKKGFQIITLTPMKTYKVKKRKGYSYRY